MKCNVAWTREFLDSSLSKAFRTGEFKNHRENILVDREKSMLPSTMPLVEIEIKKRVYKNEINDLQKEKLELLAKVREVDQKINERYIIINRNRPQSVEEIKVYQRPCPNGECRGFLSNWKCSICDAKVCSHCHSIKSENDDHECKDDDLATAKLLAKDTRYCPNESCRVPIFKIEGCSQMFCTKCHTAFDWKTGVIVKNQETIHNPHFYAWIREQNNGVVPRNPLDNICGGLPTIWTIIDSLKRRGIKIDISKYHRGLQHIYHYEIPAHPVNLVGGEIFTNLRVSYILNELSLDNWKKELQKIEKKNEKNIAFRYIFEMFTNVGIDMLNHILRPDSVKSDVDKLINEFDALRIYFNDNIYKLYKRFDSKPKYLDKNWDFITIPVEKKPNTVPPSMTI
jgi:hypothetical protein